MGDDVRTPPGEKGETMLPCMKQWSQQWSPHDTPAPVPAPKPKPAPATKPAKVYTPATEQDRRFARALSGVKSWNTTFTHGAVYFNKFTDAQREYLARMVWRYRRQIADKGAVELAKGIVDAMGLEGKRV